MKPNRRETISLLAGAAPVALGLLSAGGITSHALAQETKPNILFILVDNLGYGELGVYGGGATRGAPTPRIDRLAGGGRGPPLHFREGGGGGGGGNRRGR